MGKLCEMRKVGCRGRKWFELMKGSFYNKQWLFLTMKGNDQQK
jgi:hypothetical protein